MNHRLDNLFRSADWPEVLALRDQVVALISDAEAETGRLAVQVELLAQVNTDLNALCNDLRKQNVELRERWAEEVAKQVGRG